MLGVVFNLFSNFSTSQQRKFLTEFYLKEVNLILKFQKIAYLWALSIFRKITGFENC